LFHVSHTEEDLFNKTKKKLNSMAWVREQTIPTKRSALVGEVSTSFCG
jgi:hypothetical protein